MGALFATRFLAFRDPAKERARPVKGIVATGMFLIIHPFILFIYPFI